MTYTLNIDDATPLGMRVLNYLRRNKIAFNKVIEPQPVAAAESVPPGWVDYEDGVYYYPTEETVAALEESKRMDKHLPRYNNVEDFFKSMGL